MWVRKNIQGLRTRYIIFLKFPWRTIMNKFYRSVLFLRKTAMIVKFIPNGKNGKCHTKVPKQKPDFFPKL
jgi:hypothetical protein